MTSFERPAETNRTVQLNLVHKILIGGATLGSLALVASSAHRYLGTQDPSFLVTAFLAAAFAAGTIFYYRWFAQRRAHPKPR